MLRDLSIKNLLLIDRLDLEFQPGLNVLTGETGAGKSILLDSLGFVLGWRGRADLVRQGADYGEVTAVFDISKDHPALAVLEDAGITFDEELILRRRNSKDGRKTAYVNDQRCSGEVLRALSDVLIELHGQHDDRGLMDPRGHRVLLDSYGDVDTAPVEEAWADRRRLTREHEALVAALEAAEKERDFLEFSIAELRDLDPQPGEDTALDAKRRLMQGAERIRDDIVKAHTALTAEGAEGQMLDAARWLEGVADKAEGRLDAALGALMRAQTELGEAQRGVEECLSALEFNPAELEQIEERLFAIRALSRKHGVPPDELGVFAEEMARKHATLEAGADEIAAVEAALDTAMSAYDAAALSVSEARGKAAAKLALEMAGELAPLKLERAEFVVDIEAAQAGPHGFDNVQFMVATNPGAPAGPINKIASGGELSRFMLALKVCLTRGASGMTLIFDEIDRGVGGATADAVGKRLAEIAADGQVLVVTHSPQVAARGGHQWRVAKSVEGDETFSRVVPMNGAARVDEIARMLAGDTITEEARAAAKSLLAG